MLFESSHSLDENEFILTFNRNLHFPTLHIHRSFELYAQLEGETDVVVGEHHYTLSPDQAVLIFPFQTHSYLPKGETRHALCIFSSDVVPDFHKKTAHLLPTDNRFSFHIDEDVKTDNIFLKRAFLYRVCGEFERGREYHSQPQNLNDNILTELLLYVNRNFRSECLLRDAAASIGYDYAYISKFFKQKTGISFRQYVNTLRIRECQHLLRTTTQSISEIKDECGFRCLRTFNREFLAVTGITASEYRRNIAIIHDSDI